MTSTRQSCVVNCDVMCDQEVGRYITDKPPPRGCLYKTECIHYSTFDSDMSSKLTSAATNNDTIDVCYHRMLCIVSNNNIT
jgi:hypothetical protein